MTGTDMEEASATRAAVSQTGSSDQSESKTVTATKSFTIRTALDDATNLNNFLEGITKGSRQYYYSEDGFTGTLYSYKYDVVSAPYIEGGYRIFPVKVYYTGTVYKY